jgi:hypothetical protein
MYFKANWITRGVTEAAVILPNVAGALTLLPKGGRIGDGSKG